MVIGHGYAKLNPPARTSRDQQAGTPGVLLARKCVASSTAETAGSIDPRDTRVQSSRRDLRAWRNASGRILGANPQSWDAGSRGGENMFDLRDLFQWERFITPSIIKVFYWLAVIIMVLSGLSGILSGLALMMVQPIGGLFLILVSVVGTLAGVIFVRILSEFVLITFRINEHLGAIRNREQM